MDLFDVLFDLILISTHVQSQPHCPPPADHTRHSLLPARRSIGSPDSRCFDLLRNQPGVGAGPNAGYPADNHVMVVLLRRKCSMATAAPTEYYGYNSTINAQGTRVRRARRTEYSANRVRHSNTPQHQDNIPGTPERRYRPSRLSLNSRYEGRARNSLRPSKEKEVKEERFSKGAYWTTGETSKQPPTPHRRSVDVGEYYLVGRGETGRQGEQTRRREEDPRREEKRQSIQGLSSDYYSITNTTTTPSKKVRKMEPPKTNSSKATQQRSRHDHHSSSRDSGLGNSRTRSRPGAVKIQQVYGRRF